MNPRQLDLFARVATPRIAAPNGLAATPPALRTHPAPIPELDDHTSDTWARRIVELLQDGQARTFEAMLTELLHRRATAAQACGTNAEQGLWIAVATNQLLPSQRAPVEFRLAAPIAAATPTPAPTGRV
jgi:hypothetical protein